MTDKKVFKLIRAAERNRTGKNFTRWYSSVHPRRNGEADIKTWAVKTYNGKPLILLATIYPTDGGQAKVSGRCLISTWDNCPHWNWLDYGGKGHVAVWSDVDACRNEMLDAYDHSFNRGIEFFGLGTFVNGFEGTKYQYGQFADSMMRVTDWLDCMHISPKTELVIKAGLLRWLDPRYLPTLMDNKPLLAFVRKNAEVYRGISPYFVIREFKRTDGGKIDESRAMAYTVCKKYRFDSLAFPAIRILRWLKAQKVEPSLLRHHIDNLKELGMDLTYQPHVLPKDFATYSLDIEERVHQKREEARLANEAAALERERVAREARIFARRQIRKWLAEGKIAPRFSIVIPNTETEMRDEGHAMHNCVGGYYSRWKAGSCDLAFIRKDGKPYIDIEIGGDRIIQARYAHNEAVDTTSKDYKICELALAAFKRVA